MVSGLGLCWKTDRSETYSIVDLADSAGRWELEVSEVALHGSDHGRGTCRLLE